MNAEINKCTKPVLHFLHFTHCINLAASVLQYKERCSRMDLTPQKFLMIKLFLAPLQVLSLPWVEEANSKKPLQDFHDIQPFLILITAQSAVFCNSQSMYLHSVITAVYRRLFLVQAESPPSLYKAAQLSMRDSQGKKRMQKFQQNFISVLIAAYWSHSLHHVRAV